MTLSTLYYDIGLVILTGIVALAIVDESFTPFLNIQLKILMVNIRRQWMLLKMKPDMWLMRWRMQRVLKKLQQDQELQAMVKEHQEMMDARDAE